MAQFETKVVKITITPHDNADTLEIAQVGGYKSIVLKGLYKTGDLAAYIQEGSIVPDDIIEELGLTGRLAGSKANRVKALRLRGVFSQGLLYPARPHWNEGDDVKDELNIVKYVPEVPVELQGEAFALPYEHTFHFDIDDIKKHPHILEEGEEVILTEKLHGTFCAVTAVPDAERNDANYFKGRVFVASKGCVERGYAFKTTNENAYNKQVQEDGLIDIAILLSDRFKTTVRILGELFGCGIQDLHYGFTSKGQTAFRVFAICMGDRNEPTYLGDYALDLVLEELGMKRVPKLYRGPFSQAVLEKYTSGKESFSGKETNMREGVVVTLAVERKADGLPGNRVILKSVSPEYLTRKGGTEYS